MIHLPLPNSFDCECVANFEIVLLDKVPELTALACNSIPYTHRNQGQMEGRDGCCAASRLGVSTHCCSRPLVRSGAS